MTDYLDNYLEKTPKEKLSKSAIAFLASLDHLFDSHPQIAKNILQELNDQRSYIKLIASENFSSLAVQLAMGNLLTDKYAEGYPFHRFYSGCDNVDSIEDIASNELKSLFHAEHAYVQPHSGADANLIAFWSILIQRVQNKELEKYEGKSIDQLTPEEHEKIRKLLNSQKLLGMSLNSGGHLTHGYRHNVTAKIMQAASYDVDKNTHLLDYKAISDQVKQFKPLILLAGYSAYTRNINFAKMREIADSVRAVFVVDMAHFSGLVAGKVFTGEFNPVPYAHILTSTTHKTLRGPRGGFILCTSEFADTINKGCPLAMGGPLPHVMAAKAIAFKEANTKDFQTYAAQIVKNAQALGESLMDNGIPVLTGGTDNHMVIADLSQSPLNGRQAEKALRQCGMTVNRNSIPDDPEGPWYTSGIRIGTPAMTTLGMKEDDIRVIGKLITEVLTFRHNAHSIKILL